MVYSFPILAFGFASPWMLWGLAMGSVPVIIHLLHKRRYQVVDWAAMRFLLAAAKKNARRLRLEQLLLLAVRVLILLLLALALAQPFVESFGSYFQADVPTHRILVVDASYSMAHRQGEFSRFERAKAVARQIALDTRQGDALNLVRISQLPPQAVVREPAFQKSQVIGEIDQLQRTDQPGDLIAALEAVGELLKAAPGIPQKEVYLLSDLQRSSWTPDSASGQSKIRELLDEIAGRASLIVFDLGQPQTPNTAVVEFSARQPFVTVGRPVDLQAAVHNFGDAPATGRGLELYVDDRLAERREVTIPAGGERRVDFSYTFNQSGEHSLEMRLQDDDLPIDNRRWLSLPAKEFLNVLLVNGRQAGRATDNATHFLEVVLSPSTERQTWRGDTRATVINELDLIRTDLTRFDCVFLCNVGLFNQNEAEILRTYVESGGGLVICLGDNVKPDPYNLVLFQDGEGVLPARLGNRVGSSESPDEVYRFDTSSLGHPIVNVFEGNPNTGLEKTMTLAYQRLHVPQDDAGRRVALRFDSGDPAIVDAKKGRGRVILLATSVDNRWGPWPLQPSFPPMIHETVQYVVSGRWGERQKLVGEPLTRAFPTRTFSMPVTMVRPDGNEQSIRLTESDTFAGIAYEATDRAGLYEVTLGPPLGRTELFAVNVAPQESNLAKVQEAELESELLPGIDFAYQTHWRDVQQTAQTTAPQRGGLTRWLLFAAFGLLFVEQLMAWNFYSGFLMLYAVAALGLVRSTLLWHGAAGIALATLLVAGFLLLVVRGQIRSRRLAE